MPSKVQQITQDTTDTYAGLDAGIRHKILRKAKVQQDRALTSISLAIMEQGEVLGLEECQHKAQQIGNLLKRQHTVVCKANGSTVLFLPY